MHSTTLPSYPSRAGHGVSDSVRSLVSSAVAYLEARLQLVKLESGEAMRLGLRIVILALVIVTSAFVAYVCGMVGLVLWIAETWWSGHILPAVLIVAGSHLLIAAISGVIIAFSTRGHPLYQNTLKEFKEDRRWLHTHQPTTFKN